MHQSETPKQPKHDQAFAIVRYDDFLGQRTEVSQKLAIKRVLWDHSEAVREVDRLNSLESGKGSVYFLLPTRVDRRLSASDSLAQPVHDATSEFVHFGVHVSDEVRD
jgi:hypothetical protein